MNLEFKSSKNLASIKKISHGFFTKNGGDSSGVYNSLNCSPNSDDLPANVTENRQHVMETLGVSDGKLFGLDQIHST